MRGGWFPNDPPDGREIFDRCMVVVVLISMLAALCLCMVSA
jgi:hypothetical protein